MKVIFLTQYFPPETGAPQNRLHAMAHALQEQGAEVTVLTAMPHYPEMEVHAAYRRKWCVREQMDGLELVRCWIHASKGRGIVARLMNYFSFVLSSLWIGAFHTKRSDILLVESPPLFLGITAMLLARMKRAKLVFNVSDLWPESAVQLGLVTNRSLIRLSTWLEMMCYRRSALITGQTQGIVADISKRCPQKRVVWIPNGVDLKAIAEARSMDPAQARERLGCAPGDLVLAYAGILGHAQGLQVVIEAARLLKEEHHIRFLLIGDGPERARLMEEARAAGTTNVRFVERMPRAELLGLLRGIDGVVVPLRKNDLFKGAIPSKIFEALALGKPLLLGVEGEAKELFIDQGGAGIAFEPENARALADAVLRMDADRQALVRMGGAGEAYARRNFDRAAISERLWKELGTIVLP